VQTDAEGEVIGFDVLRGVGEALGVEFGGDEVPGGAAGAAEEGVDGAGAGADVDAGDVAGEGGGSVVRGAGGVEEGLEPFYVFVAGICQHRAKFVHHCRLTARVPSYMSGANFAIHVTVTRSSLEGKGEHLGARLLA